MKYMSLRHILPIHLIITKTVLPFSCFLNKETSIENSRLIFKPCNCNFLPKLQSNDYRHEVEPDNNARKKQEKKKKHILLRPLRHHEGGRGREREKICQLKMRAPSLQEPGFRSGASQNLQFPNLFTGPTVKGLEN